MFGLVREGNIINVPFGGLRTDLSRRNRIYPILNGIIANECMEKKLLYHGSLGAEKYKMGRGYQKFIEYIEHLPLKQNIMWRTLQRLTRLFFGSVKI